LLVFWPSVPAGLLALLQRAALEHAGPAQVDVPGISVDAVRGLAALLGDDVERATLEEDGDVRRGVVDDVGRRIDGHVAGRVDPGGVGLGRVDHVEARAGAARGDEPCDDRA